MFISPVAIVKELIFKATRSAIAHYSQYQARNTEKYSKKSQAYGTEASTSRCCHLCHRVPGTMINSMLLHSGKEIKYHG